MSIYRQYLSMRFHSSENVDCGPACSQLRLCLGRALTQAVSRRPLTAEVRVCAPVGPCEICGGQSGTGTGSSPSSSVFPVSIIPPWFYVLMYQGDEQ
jgi:hypothetical protein